GYGAALIPTAAASFGQSHRQRKMSPLTTLNAWFTPVTMPTIRSNTSPIMRSYLLVWPWVPRGDVPAEELAHEPSDHVPFAFQREVAGVEQVELYRLEVSLVRLGPGRREDLVVGAPHNQHRRLVLPEVLLPLRVERRVT